MRKVFVYAGTENLYRQMSVALTSLMQNTVPDRVYFLTEDDSFPYPLPDCVRVLNVSNQTYFNPDGPNYKNRLTYMTLIRTALAKLLPDEERVLYMDVDTIVDGDISELFSLDMDGFLFGAVREPAKSNKIFTYHNAGVLLMNLELIRKTGRDDEMIDHLNRYPIELMDQDVLNLYCQGRIRTIGPEYNSTIYTEVVQKPKIYHYPGVTDWTDKWAYKKYEKQTQFNWR